MKNTTLIARLFAAAMLSACAMSTVYAAEPQATPDAAVAAPDDAAVAAKVKTALAEFKQVNVGAAKGVVSLSGTVASAEQATQVAQLAAAVEGVKEVKNAVSVAAK